MSAPDGTTDVAVADRPGTDAWDDPEARKEAARQHYRHSIEDGNPITGAALGPLFNRSARWGTDRTAEVNAQLGHPPSRRRQRRHQPDLDPRSGNLRHLPTADPAIGNGPTAADHPSDDPAAAHRSGSAATTNASLLARDRQPVGQRRDTHTAAVAVCKTAVRLVAAAVSYDHMRTVAERAGEEAWQALVLPISVDGLAVLALLTMAQQRRDGLRPSAWCWTALVLSVVASIAANIAAAEPTADGRLVAAWSPVALLLAELMDRPRPGAQS